MSTHLKHIETCPSCWKKPSFSHFSPGKKNHPFAMTEVVAVWSMDDIALPYGVVEVGDARGLETLGSSVGMDVDPQSVGTRHGESPFSMGKWSFLGIHGGFMGFNGKSPCYSGKTDYVYSPCSIAMLNCRRVILLSFLCGKWGQKITCVRLIWCVGK